MQQGTCCGCIFDTTTKIITTHKIERQRQHRRRQIIMQEESKKAPNNIRKCITFFTTAFELDYKKYVSGGKSLI